MYNTKCKIKYNMKELRLQYNKESVMKKLHKNKSIVLERYLEYKMGCMGKGGSGGINHFRKIFFVDKINFCTAMVIVVLVLLNSG